MGLKVGEILTVSFVATLAGAPGTFEGDPVLVFEPSDVVGSVTIADDKLSATATVVREIADANVTVMVDNVVGTTVGVLSGSATFTTLPADVLSADALDVTVS